MKNWIIIYLTLVATIMSGCKDSVVNNDNSLVPNIRPDYQVSNELNVPKLSVGVGIESGYIHISWTSVDSVTYYELEQSFDVSFSTSFLDYAGIENSLTKPPSGGVRSFYRVRVIYNGMASRWSNVGGH